MQCRLSHKMYGPFSTLERDMICDLIQLSTSHYSDVRIKAQSALTHFKRPYSQRLVIPKLLEKLKNKDMIEHEELKGILSILLGQKRTSLFIVSDWPMLNQLWSLFVTAPYSEKPSIIDLIDKLSKLAIQKFNHPIIDYKISDELKDIVREHWNQGIALNTPLPTQEAIEIANAKCLRSNEENLNSYLNLISNLVNSIEQNSLHWRHALMAFTFLQLLVREDSRFPAEAVKVLVQNLNNDHLSIRRTCVNSLSCILKQIEPKINHSILQDFSNFSSSDLLMYKTNIDYNDPQVWSSLKFVPKSYLGFYAWPKNGLKYYSEDDSLKPKSIDNLEDDERAIWDFFSSKEKVEKMLLLMKLDEKKEGGRFNSKRLQFFKGLFKIFGINIIEYFCDFFVNLTVDTKENIQKFGSELLSGLIRGSKYWSYSDMVKLQAHLSPFFQKIFEVMTPEIVDYWMDWANFSFHKTDARRFSWLIDSLMSDIFDLSSASFSIATSFQRASKIHCLTIILQCQSWRSLHMFTKIVDHLLSQNHLKNSYQNIREKIGLLLTNALLFDVKLNCLPEVLSVTPKIKYFVEKVNTDLEFLKDKNDSINNGNSSDTLMNSDTRNHLNETDEQKDALNLLKIICIWLNHHFFRSPSLSHPQYFLLLPTVSYACQCCVHFV